ncbi:MAG: glycosyltransferase [Candidatus Nomurabacteria bacterium]|jgi:cellulose synthase/poly-beta-1,6-N-acetylglucosamine synthase-like glycosyltransferase|nr:glycosyltransferase [Candidatus Nomurabacteria bacterium]
MDLEIPIGKRKPLYRFFEILPATLSFGAFALLIVLSIINPTLGAVFMLLVIIAMLVKAVGIAYHTIKGQATLEQAGAVDWSKRLLHLEDPADWYARLHNEHDHSFGFQTHLENLRFIAAAEPDYFPKPSHIYHAVIIATYNEAEDVLRPTIESVLGTNYDNQRMVVVLAYEERGGEETDRLAHKLQQDYQGKFFDFQIVKHPEGIKNEVTGKGGNITYAGSFLKGYFDKRDIKYSDVIITTLDSDNRPHKSYFDCVAYEYICHENRKHLSYQPVSLFMNNIWDVPAPMRVIATGNSFWNIISSMRQHSLRNFASHSQSLDALVEMDFWSTRTIVEDGHQFWRSYFYFDGNYSVLPIHVPIYQDAVLSFTYWKTLKAQFVQLRRWGYGASDVPYVATRVFTKKRKVGLFDGIAKFWRLLDSHVTLASVAPIVMFGGWIPLLVNADSTRSVVALQLPVVVSWIQRVAMVGLFITILLALKTLPKRPTRYKKHRTALMVLQWILMPITSVVYNSIASLNAQTHLALGRYLDKFDVTDKATHESIIKDRRVRRRKKR